ncbi:MAG TPA: hypothetical protein VNN22_20645 [Verrucomicrobiae bacterium]|nr:hypothetical protein [Verrucomicrobiae bacterium]
MKKFPFLPAVAFWLLATLPLFGSVLSAAGKADANEPRIVNIYNFVRNSDYRVPDSEEVLYETTRKQIELIKPTGLPATWALQYDALINPRYQKLFKEQLGPKDEIAAWWEIPRPLVKKAGLQWRGHDHEWDSTANVGFSPGYTPEERRKLVDIYMADFKAIFGCYPRTVGSWFIDEVTLEYMAERYGIVASCNCKDQVGTDGYTLWGGYWNQAYYPSRLNAYMPAQTKAGQINVPIFRMLGSDPIYQGYATGMWTLEPVYPQAGGSTDWVAWFMKEMIQQPSLGFAYTQAGQENSFGWEAMKTGLTLQIALLARQAKAGEIQIMTLEQAGEWFRHKYIVTPPTAVVALDDWKHENRKTVWYDSRFYRLNMLWENGRFFIRDLHCFDQKVVSPTHDSALTTTFLAYETLPMMDSALWSVAGTKPAGMWPVLFASDGTTSPMSPEGPPVVKELNRTDLSITQPLAGGGVFSMICSEAKIVCTAVDGDGKPLRWAWNLAGGAQQQVVVQAVASNGITYHYAGVNYEPKLSSGMGSCQQLSNGDIRLCPNNSGKLELFLNVTE